MNDTFHFYLVVFAFVLLSSRASVGGSESIDCPSLSKPCVSLCCSWGETRWEGSCVEDNETAGILSGVVKVLNYSGKEISGQDYHLFKNDPCLFEWMTSYVVKNFSVDENGSVSAPDFEGGLLSGFEEYCILREQGTTEYLAKICRPWVTKTYWELACAIIVVIIMLTIFVIYIVVPELRNLHGLIICGYTASYIGLYICVLGVIFTIEVRSYSSFYTFFDITGRYFCSSCISWLTVMSYNIWRSFRNIRPVCYHWDDYKRRSIINYAIYAWFGPAVLFAVVAALLTYVPYFRHDTNRAALKHWGIVVLVVVPLSCNAFLLTSTAFNIKNFKRNTSDLIDGVNRHRESEKQWFNLYLKLFVIMGFHIVSWPSFIVWPTPAVLHTLAVFEVVQSALIFVLFILNGNAKRTLHERFISNSAISSHGLNTSEIK